MSPKRNSSCESIWLAIILLSAAIVAGGVAVLTRLYGGDEPDVLAVTTFFMAGAMGMAARNFLR